MAESVPSAAYVENMLNSDVHIATHLFDAEHVEKSPITDMLTTLIGAIDNEMRTVNTYLGHCTNETHENVTEMLKMVQAFETTKANFKFVLDVLASKSDSEIAEIKDNLTTIKEKYEKICNVEDIAVVPIKYVLMLIYSKVLPMLKRVVKESFKESYAEVELESSEAHIERVRIATHRSNICNKHFHTVVTLPKDDIFRLEKSSPFWQDLYKDVVFKKINTYEEVMSSFKIVHFTVLVGFATMNNRAKKKPNSAIEKYVNLFKDTLYYGVDQDRLETDASHFLINPPLEEAFKVWNIPENFFVSKALQARLPFIGHDELIYVPRMFPSITKEQILKEYANGTINKLCPTPLPEVSYGNANRSDIVDGLLIRDENKVGVRVIASEPLDIRGNEKGMVGGLFQRAINVVKGSDSCSDQAIVIHVHGGGFVSLSSSSHRSYLLKWAKNLKLVHFSIDYRLAPEHSHPETLDDVWQAYLWIMHFAESILAIKTQKVILIGDSAGANLIFALTLRLIRAGLKTPDGLVLLYPSLSMDINNFSPSYFLSLDDRLLPYSLMNLVIKAHTGEDIDGAKDPFVSPMLASDELLEKLPPVRIVSGSNDPLHDENWRLLARLKGLKKEAKFVVHENLSHAYLSNQDLKNYDTYCDEACDLIRELLV